MLKPDLSLNLCSLSFSFSRHLLSCLRIPDSLLLRHSTATTATTAAVVNTQSGVLTLTSVSDIDMTAAQGKMIFYSTYFSSLGITGLFLSTIIVMLAMIFTAWVKYVLNGF